MMMMMMMMMMMISQLPNILPHPLNM